MNLVQVSVAPVRRRAGSVAALTVALVMTPALTGCAPDTVASGGQGESRLKPRFDMADRPGQAGKGQARAAQAGKGQVAKGREARRGAGTARNDESAGDTTGTTTPSAQPSPAPTSAATPKAPAPQAPGGPITASLADPRGDTSGGLGTPPAHVDLTGATVTRSEGGFEVRVDVAGPLPARQQGSQIQHVAIFYDLDGDALVDYETWATLSDDGWGGSYRTPDSARFGSDSGVSARPDGATLVLTFPLSHLRGAKAFRWQVGSEWGTYEQVASGTTASDRAGDGGVPFPS